MLGDIRLSLLSFCQCHYLQAITGGFTTSFKLFLSLLLVSICPKSPLTLVCRYFRQLTSEYLNSPSLPLLFAASLLNLCPSHSQTCILSRLSWHLYWLICPLLSLQITVSTVNIKGQRHSCLTSSIHHPCKKKKDLETITSVCVIFSSLLYVSRSSQCCLDQLDELEKSSAIFCVPCNFNQLK